MLMCSTWTQLGPSFTLLKCISLENLIFILAYGQIINRYSNIRSLHLCLSIFFRFDKGKIYTYIGEVVVSVNPYRSLDIYDRKHVDDYKGREIYERPPHIFAIADGAYKAMKRRAKDTCIVISGKKNSYSTRSWKWECFVHLHSIGSTREKKNFPYFWIISADFRRIQSTDLLGYLRNTWMR